MVVFTEIGAFFAASHLAKALDAELFVMNTKYASFFGSSCATTETYCGDNTENITNGDITIIGFAALEKIHKRIENGDFERVNYIISDTLSCINYKWWNDFVVKNNIDLYIMPDIEHYCFVNYKPIYQYMEINKNLLLPKPKKLLITHSPRSNHKIKTKGTNEIERFISKLKKKHDFDFKLITGLEMDNALKEKSKSHIHIDQLVFKNKNIEKHWGEIKYHGALGKSGLEAMMLGCCVITGAPEPKTMPHFESPPIVWTSFDDFYKDLEFLIVNKDERRKQIKKQNYWVKNIISNKEFYKKYLTER